MNIKIFTPGDKLRLIRKKYKLKQDELSGTYITRNMISMIETNKAALNPATAKVLLDNLYTICAEKALECDATLEDLLESPTTQVRTIVLEFMKALNDTEEFIESSLYNGDYLEVVLLLDQHGLLKEKALLHETIAKYYASHKSYETAYLYYLMAFECLPRTLEDNTFPNLTLQIIECCYHLKEFSAALNYAHILFIYKPKIADDILYPIKYYVILCYKQLNEYEKTLIELDSYIDHFHTQLKQNPDKRIHLLLLKGECLKKIHRYPEALNIYQQILRIYDLALEYQILATLPIVHIHIESENLPLATHLLEEILPLISIYEKVSYRDYLIEIYIHIAQIYEGLGNKITSLDYYYKALDCSKAQLNATAANELVHLLLIQISYFPYSFFTKLLTNCIELIKLELISDINLITELIILCHKLLQPELLNQLLMIVKESIKEKYKNKDYL